MNSYDFHRWTVKELRAYLLQYDIHIKDIQGTGKNGNVIKEDLIRTINEIEEGIQLNETPNHIMYSKNKSPQKSQRTINEIEEGIQLNETPSLIMYPKNKSPQKSQQEITLNNDVLGLIYGNITDIDTLASICSTNKSVSLLCNSEKFWQPIFQYHDVPMVKLASASAYIKHLKKKILPKILLNNPKPNKEHQTFEYYSKTYTIPNIGDIIIVEYVNFSHYYILVTSVTLNTGKDGTIFAGYGLREKGSSYDSVTSPAFLKSRTQLESTGKYYRVNPKDRRRFVRVEVSDL